MRVLYLNNDGGGFADHIEVPEGTTVEKFFLDHVTGGNSRDYLIRVNRQPASAGQILQSGDRLSITPVKIQGATP